MAIFADAFNFIADSTSVLDFRYIADEVIPTLNRGLWVSVTLIVPSAIMGFLLGIIIGTGRVFGGKYIRRIMDMYTIIVRGVPLVVQLFILYYALPKIGLRFPPYVAGVMGFTMCSGAYHSEYIRGALLSIKQGQIRAAHALGFSTFKTILWVVIPQAVRRALPGCSNELIYLIKYSSLASAIVIMELTGEGIALAEFDFKYKEVYLMLGLYYLAITSTATVFVHLLEKKLAIPGFGMAKGKG